MHVLMSMDQITTNFIIKKVGSCCIHGISTEKAVLQPKLWKQLATSSFEVAMSFARNGLCHHHQYYCLQLEGSKLAMSSASHLIFSEKEIVAATATSPQESHNACLVLQMCCLCMVLQLLIGHITPFITDHDITTVVVITSHSHQLLTSIPLIAQGI